jgi:hypothetical protein
LENNMPTYQLQGSILDASTRKGIEALTIEAWGKAAKAGRKLATAMTDAAGKFALHFDLQPTQQNPNPLGFVKVLRDETLLQTLPEQPIRQWTEKANPLVVELHQPQPQLQPPPSQEPQPSPASTRILLALRFTSGKSAAGVQLVFSYALPAGGAWTSQPLTADAEGNLSFEMPMTAGTVIDWSRATFAFSKAGRPLEIVAKSPPQQTSTGIAIAVELKTGKITLPTPDPAKRYVRGRVSTSYGEGVVASVSATVVSLQGEQSLGQVPTTDTGRYEIIYQWDGKCAPDIQVSATVQDKLVARSDIRFAAGKSLCVDLIADNEAYVGPTEFQGVEASVLKCNGDFDIAAIGEKQFAYLLGKTRVAEDKLSFYLVARKLSAACEVPTAVFYGLFRAKLPATLQGLVLQPPKVLKRALDKSIRQNIIERKYQKDFDSLLAALGQMAVAGSLGNQKRAGVGDLLTMAQVPAPAQQQLIGLYVAHTGDDASFWEALRGDAQLAPYAEQTKTTLQLGALTMYHAPAMQAFKSRLGAGSVKDLAAWRDVDWQSFAKDLDSVPDGIPGDALPKRIQFYVDNMSRSVRRAFAREYTTANILRSDSFASPVLHDFLNSVPEFDYGNSSITAVLDETQITGEARQELESTLKSLQRLYRLAPIEQKFPVVDSLYAGGLTSARDIAALGRPQFVDLYGSAIGGPAIADDVFNKAATVSAVSTSVLAGYGDLYNASSLYGIGGGVAITEPKPRSGLVIPSYKDLFGSQSFCECRHCTSVYSPAAYFVDLVEYLRQSLVTKKIGGSTYVKIIKDGVSVNKTGQDVLFARRPDLGDIRLDCKNTNTVLPYIDLVNEIYERAVVGASAGDPPQTTWTEQELRANPEFVQSGAYDTLAESIYPLSLPFRLWNVEASHYLNHLGEPRWKLMQTVADLPKAGGAGFEQVSLAYLGLSTIDVEILTGAPAYSGTLDAVASTWGYTTSGWRAKLAEVPEFLERSRLSYDELLQLLQVPYVQEGGEFGVDFSDAESPCDIDGAVLRYTNGDPLLTKDTFDSIQRFLRLLRKTGWSIWELGRVLAALPKPQIELATLVQVSVLKQLAAKFGLDVLEVISWWADMDTALDGTDEEYRSWYETVFLNPAVLNPPDQTLLLATDRTHLAVEDAGGALISGHLSSIAAALQISESAATVLAQNLVDGTGAIDDALTLRNLGRMFRIVSLSRALDMDIDQYFLMKRLIGDDPLNAKQPEDAMLFVDAVQAQQRSSFSSAELAYLLLHDEASVGSVQKSEASIAELLSAIQSAVRAVWVRYQPSSAPVIEQLTARLGDYFEQPVIDLLIATIGKSEPYSPDDEDYLQETLAFLPAAGLLAAVRHNRPVDARYANLLTLLNRYGRSAGSINVVSQIVADAFSLDLTVAQQLLTDVVGIDPLLDTLFIDSGKEKLAAVLPTEFQQEAFNIIEGNSVLTDTEVEAFITLHFDFLDPAEAMVTLLGADALSDVLERYQYVTSTLDAAQFTLSDTVFAGQFAAIRAVQKSAMVIGKFGITETELPFLHSNAVALGILPLQGYPFSELKRNFSGFAQWRDLGDLLSLRRVFVATDSSLVTQLGKILDPDSIDLLTTNAEVDALIASGAWQEAQRPLLVWLHELASATGWSFPELAFAAGPDLLGATLADMSDVATLARLAELLELATRLGTTVTQLKDWSALDLSQTDAANAKQTARARYTLEQWYGVAPELRDVLREQQRDALTEYMLHQGNFSTIAELYDHYLIDSEMSAVVLTSRLKLGLSSVQLFLQRCLLNLEQEFVAVTAADEWEWRKNYRVWEANRKVFLYPENYIRPELRLTRSETFDSAQSILLQNEVTEEVAEAASLHYLERLDDVSNLQVVGSYHETGVAEDGVTAIDRLHVIGRTRGIPHKYYYRVRDAMAWAPWEAVDADIGADQVMPVVINSRLYLFWPVFLEKQIAGVDVLGSVARQDAKDAKALEMVGDYETYLFETGFIIDNVACSQYLDENEVDPNGIWDFLTFTVNGDPLSDSGFDSLEQYARWIFPTNTLDEVIALIVATTNAKTLDELVAENESTLDGAFEETFPYLEIKLVVSEYKNGKWLPSRTSEPFIDSDQKQSAISLLDGNQVAPVAGDFHFYTAVAEDIVTIDCVQTLRYTNSPSREYREGSFDYNVLSREFVASDADDDSNFPTIAHPSGSDIVDNAFIEDDEHTLEIPVIGEGWWSTTYLPLLERTPGTFRLPIQHQYEQFSVSDSFFYGDDRRSFIVTPEETMAMSGQISDADIAVLDDYLGSDSPGIGVYGELMQGAVAKDAAIQNQRAASPGTFGDLDSLSTAGSDMIDGLVDTQVAEYHPLTRDIYQFETFYHPLVGELIKKLNGEGIAAALSRDTQGISEKYFIAAYEPTDDVAIDYPIRNFSFSDLDANGFYNYEWFFHVPLLIAMRLSKNQQFAAAQQQFHAIFDPTSCSAGAGAQRFWQFKPFFDLYDSEVGHPFESIYDMLSALAADPATADAATLEIKRRTEQQIAVWRANPFDPHAIAALRPVAYMKTVVMEYLNNLIAWGDYLFEQFTIEATNEAVQLYTLAQQILGDRPVSLPELEVVAKTYNELGALDAFSNAAAELENLINLPTAPTGGASPPPLYFCIPNNPTLLTYWDTVADRLFKIRHGMTIEGVVQQMPLFEPPIDPALLVLARASGVSISSALASLATPAPHYRFVHLMQKAVEYCQVVKGLGSQLLAAYEKQDAETLGQLRAAHEESLLKATTELRNLQVDEARENLAATEKSKALVTERITYYSNMERRSEKEKASTKCLDDAELKRIKSSAQEQAASRWNLLPNVSISGPVPGFSASYGGGNIGASVSANAAESRGESEWNSYRANKLGTDASYERRWDEWKFQQRLAKNELKQVEKQIVAAQVRLALAEKERDNHAIQVQQSREVSDFLTGKYSNDALYGWMVSQTSAIYFQSYKLAYDLAKRCEKAYQRESGETGSSYIAYGYFDSTKKGLLAGERLHHDLQRLESDYLNNNRRELEITKPISLFQLNPSALLKLRETGACDIHLPEEEFDQDFAGHYFRRIKAVRLTIPCVVGPHANVSATLRLMQSWTRREAPADLSVAPEPDVTMLPQTAIALSSGNGDSGMFEFNFRDERYLPFEGAGAISSWRLELPRTIRGFDYSAIADVLIHLSYSARDGGETCRRAVDAQLLDAINDWKKLVDVDGAPLERLFSMRQEFSADWNRFLAGEDSQEVTLHLGKQHFPRQLDYLWDDMVQKPIALHINALKVYLNPQGMPANAAGISINDKTSTIDPENGLPVFDVDFAGAITNESGIDLTLTVNAGEVRATDWKDMQVLMNYEVRA